MKSSCSRLALSTLAAIALSLLAVTSAAATATSPASGPAIPGEVVAKFTPAGIDARAAALDAIGATAGSSVRGVPGTRLLELPPGDSVEAALARLREQPGISWAEPNYRVTVARVPNDPLFSNLWGLRNFGQEIEGVAGVPGLDIDAEGAWETTVGSRSVRVAVVDSGIDGTHPDLAANLDGPLSRNFASATPLLEPVASSWEDPNGHGTHVAGTIGAVGDNGLGVTGVSWNPDLVSARACNTGGTCTSSQVAEALAYAGQIGAKVANASLSTPQESLVMEAAMLSNPGTLYVIAAGNSTTDVDVSPTYPCASPLPNVVCVAALDNTGALAPYSNWGLTNVDIGAPGSGVYSTVPNKETRFDGSELAAWDSEPAGRWEYLPEYESIDFVSSPQPLPAETTLTTAAPVSFVGGRECHLEQELALDTVEGEQSLEVEASTDGVNWSRVQPTSPALSGSTNREFVSLPLDLSAYDGEASVYLRYRFLTTADGREGDPLVSVRGFRAVCVVAQPPRGSYEYMSGTSMASPHVAGVAALLWSAYPGADIAEVRAALLGSAVPTPSLAGRTVTGGRVDAAAAIAALAKEESDRKPAPLAVSPAPAATPVAVVPAAAWALAAPVGRRIAINRAGRVAARLHCRGTRVAGCRGRLVLAGRLRSTARRGRRVVLAARSFDVGLDRTAPQRLWLRPRAARWYRDGDVGALRLLVRTRQPAGAAKQVKTVARRVGGERRRGAERRHRAGA